MESFHVIEVCSFYFAENLGTCRVEIVIEIFFVDNNQTKILYSFIKSK